MKIQDVRLQGINDTSEYFEVEFVITDTDGKEKLFRQHFDTRPKETEQMQYATDCVTAFCGAIRE